MLCDPRGKATNETVLRLRGFVTSMMIVPSFAAPSSSIARRSPPLGLAVALRAAGLDVSS